jgi:hypothetical protein
MVSKMQLEANRANARRSTGPRTAEGKSRSRLNALKHGLSAKSIVIGDERPEDFEALRDAVVEHYRPRTALADDAADRYAATLWRLRRIPAIEAALTEAVCQRAYKEEDAALQKEYRSELWEEARKRCNAEYDDDEDRIDKARYAGVHQRKHSAIFREMSSERPFQSRRMEPIPAAQAFLTLIEAAESLDVLGKLNRYEVALMNIASRQRKELEAHRSTGEDGKVVDL